MCSYMAMFPPAIPHYFITRCTDPGDLVLDPFAGRGTTPLQACLEGRIGLGNDLNPLAYVLTAAKTDLPASTELDRRVTELEQGYEPHPDAGALLLSYQRHYEPRPSRPRWLELRRLAVRLRALYATDASLPFPPYNNEDYNWDGQAGPITYAPAHHHPIWVFFHPETLRQLSYLKQRLRRDRLDTFITATLLGIMHGNGGFFLSIPMPNTFSMTPRYVLKYAAAKLLPLPPRNVFACLRQKLARMGMPEGAARGRAFYGDVRDLPQRLGPFLTAAGRRVQLVVSSPPYLKVVKYGQYNWIRLWLLDGPGWPWSESTGSRLDVDVDARLDDGHALPAYLEFMRQALAALYDLLADDGICALVIGDVTGPREHVLLADEVWEHAARPLGYRLLARLDDTVHPSRKVTKIWGEERGQATAVDRVLVLYKQHPGVKPRRVQW
jgi:site-specific DNA-methyltransferase (adenine-specific)